MVTCAALALLVAGAQLNAAAGCGAGGYWDAYGGERCSDNGQVIDIRCDDKGNGGSCGARIMNGDKKGVGDVSMRIKAAPGNGVVTSFYLSDNGGMYAEGGSWNEIDFEIMGLQATGGGTKIWTNFFAGSPDEHHTFVSVPFDVSADVHLYTIRLNQTHIQWLVDNDPVRTDDITPFPAMQGAINGNAFQSFASVWGKSYADPNVGCQEFLDGMGKLNDNPQNFPVHSTFEPVQGAPPGTVARFQAGLLGIGGKLPGLVTAMAALSAVAAVAVLAAAVAAVRSRRVVSYHATEQEQLLSLANAKMREEGFDSI